MIVIDAETTGVDRIGCELVSLGAVDYATKKTFYRECRVSISAIIHPEAMVVNGFTDDSLFDRSKPSAKQLYDEFDAWASQFDELILAGQNPGGFDALFLHKAFDGTFSMNWKFGRRTVDLHSLAYKRFKKSLSLDGILEALGLPPEPKPHNALTGALCAASCFDQLLA